MKRILVILLLIPFFSFGQAKKPFKGANTIILQTQDSGLIALKTLAMILQDKGYSVESLDKELLNISTKYKPQTPNSYNLAINGFVRGTSKAIIVLNGIYRVTNVSDVSTFKGAKFGVDKLSFSEIERVAKSYPNAIILYEKR